MPTAKKSADKKKKHNPQASGVSTLSVLVRSAWAWIKGTGRRIVHWRQSLQPRTPHRSFRRTYRRDYTRSLDLPGYVAFTVDVWRTLWRYRSTFGLLVVVYALVSGLLLGIASQSAYSQMAESLRESAGNVLKGDAGQLGEVGAQLGVIISGGLNASPTESQQLFGSLIILMTWLTTVWLLRAFLAGHKPRLRDGLYNSGAPIVPTFLLSLFMIFQMVPAAIAAIGVSAAIPTGLIDAGVESMLFWAVALLLFLLSLYWITSTMIALVVITLPGVYPLQALKTANELVVGRRLRILYRILWLLFVTLLLWLAALAYTILVDALIKSVLPSLQWLPLVPLGLLVVGSFTVVWTASYIYLLYRKIVDDDAAPA